MNAFKEKGETLNVSLPLFDTCNLGCSFCYENHGRIPLTKERFIWVREDIRSQLLPRIRKDGYKTVFIRFYGGEIFFDRQPDWIYDEYISLIKDIRKVIPAKVKTKFITNGVFTRHDRADRVLEETDSVIGMSYDIAGRYHTAKQRNLFEKSMQHFYQIGKLVELSTLLTKPAIEAIIHGDSFFDSIPDDVRIDVCGYMPNRNWKQFMPEAEDYAKFYRWAIDNKRFNIDRITNMVRYMMPEEQNFVERFCDCDDTLTYIPAERRFSPECIERQDFQDSCYGKLKATVNDENCFEVKTSLMMNKMGCLYCEHFQGCPMQCAASVLFNQYTQNECPLARTFASITEEDIQNLKKWREQHAENA